MAIRAANLSDLDAVAEVVVSAMPHDPQWNCIYTHRHEHPEDYLKFTKLLLEYYLDPAWDDWQTVVVEVPSAEDPDILKIVSMSVWNVSYQKIRKHGSGYQPQNPAHEVMIQGGSNRKDADLDHVMTYRKALTEGRAKYWGPPTKGDQLHLQFLATDLGHLRQGFATKLVEWGMALAKHESLKLTLFASPMGFLLYSHLGWEECGRLEISLPGREEAMIKHVMAYNSRGRALAD